MQKALSFFTAFVLFFLLAAAFLHPSAELSLDLGEHIRFGELIVKNHQLPTTNIFSYTYPNAPFIHHEFFPDTLFYLLFHFFGINSLIMFTVIIVCLSFGILFFYLYKRVSRVVLFGSSFLCLRVLFERTYVRPEIFSYLFLSLFMVILLTFRKRFTTWIYLLIPLQWLWVNSHIYFILGLFLMALVLIELVVSKQAKTRLNDLKILTGVFVASCLVCLINPNGLAGALYPFTVFHNYGFSVQENNSIFTVENQNPGVIIYSILFFKIAAILLICFLFASFKKAGLFLWISSLSFIVLATSAIRNFPVFVFGAFIPFTILGQTCLRKIVLYKLEFVKTYGQAAPVIFKLFMIGIFLWQLNIVISVQGIGLGAVDKASNAVSFVQAQHIHGPFFNNYGIGSYLVFRLYPKEHVFVDARPEAYPVNFFSQTYLPMQTNPRVFEKIAKQYQFNAIIYDYPAEQTTASQLFLKSITNNPAWSMIYLDDEVVIYVKNTVHNKSFIDRYGISQSSFHLKSAQTSKASLEDLAYFFAVVGWQEKEAEAYQHLLEIDSNNCQALAYTITDLSAKGDVGAQILQYRYQTVCR